MALFRRKPTTEDTWVLATGVVDDHSVIARVKQTKRDRRRPVKVTVRITVHDADEAGLPGPQDLEALAEIEEILLAELAAHGAELVLVVTGNHAREFIAYGATHDWLADWGPTVMARWGDDRPASGIEAVAEPDWWTYRAFAP